MSFLECGDDTDVEKSIRLGSSDDDKSAITKSTLVETNPEVEETLKRFGLRLEQDGCLNWHPDASMHPRNWSVSRRIFDTSVLIALDLYTCVHR